MADGRSIHQHGTNKRRWPGYVRLDGYAGATKLFGVVVGETRRYYEFVPDRDCYQFRKGVKRRVLKEHFRPQYVEVEHP